MSAFQFKQKKRNLRRPWKLHSWAAYWVLSHLHFSCRKSYSLVVRAFPSCISCITALHITKFGSCFFLCFIVVVGVFSIVVAWSLDVFLLQTENVAFLLLNQIGTGESFLFLVLCHPSTVSAIEEVLWLVGLVWAVTLGRPVLARTLTLHTHVPEQQREGKHCKVWLQAGGNLWVILAAWLMPFRLLISYFMDIM